MMILAKRIGLGILFAAGGLTVLAVFVTSLIWTAHMLLEVFVR